MPNKFYTIMRIIDSYKSSEIQVTVAHTGVGRCS